MEKWKIENGEWKIENGEMDTGVRALHQKL